MNKQHEPNLNHNFYNNHSFMNKQFQNSYSPQKRNNGSYNYQNTSYPKHERDIRNQSYNNYCNTNNNTLQKQFPIFTNTNRNFNNYNTIQDNFKMNKTQHNNYKKYSDNYQYPIKNSTNNIKCAICAKSNHKTHECFYKDAKIICQLCSKIGHSALNCTNQSKNAHLG